MKPLHDYIIERHCKTMESDFGLLVNEQNRVLPRIFWNPKLHKTPYKARFIAGATLNPYDTGGCKCIEHGLGETPETMGILLLFLLTIVTNTFT